MTCLTSIGFGNVAAETDMEKVAEICTFVTTEYDLILISEPLGISFFEVLINILLEVLLGCMSAVQGDYIGFKIGNGEKLS